MLPSLDLSRRAALDNPIWAALRGVHALHAEGDDLARRYPADVAPFGAMARPSPDAYEALAAIVPASTSIALFTADPLAPTSRFEVARTGEMVQMVHDGVSSQPHQDRGIVALGALDVSEMVRLTALTEPGPFARRTVELGRYVGLHVGGRLVAMAGERLRFEGHVEVSAVCVDPLHRGRGLASVLVAELVTAAGRRSEIPFLHIFADNAPALALYRRLGFVPRRRMWVTRLIHTERR